MRNNLMVALSAVAFAAAALPAQAAPNLITNGNFTLVTAGSILDSGSGSPAGSATSNSKSGELTTSNVYGWSTANANPAGRGPLILYTPGTADTTGTSNGTGGNGNVALWGSEGGSGNQYYSNNGFTIDTLPGAGGNYIAADADQTYNDAVTQSLSGLTVGAQYLLTFDYAGAQEYGNYGATTEAWQVTFGNATFTTAVINTASQGFTPWRQASMTFTATSANQLLSFLAVGGPTGSPPFSLLDNVALSAVPEPTTWAVTLLGGIGATFLLRRRRKTSGAVAA